MRIKIITISIIFLFLLISMPTLPARNDEKKEFSSLDGSWVKIVRPIAGTRHFGFVILRCRASKDIDFVDYTIKADWKGDGNSYPAGPWAQKHKKPFYLKIWLSPHLPIDTGRQEVTIYACGYQYDYDKNGNITGSHLVITSPEITIYRRF